MSETDQKTRSRFQHPLARVLPLAGGVLGAMAFAITVIPLDLPWASSNAESPAVVTFDTAKYVNARRAAASELLRTVRQEIQPYPHWLASTMAFAQRSLMQQMALWSSSVKQPSWTALFLTSLTPYWLV